MCLSILWCWHLKGYNFLHLISNGLNSVNIKDAINPLQLLKNANFSIKTTISLNRQFTVDFNSIICFSVQFYDNSQLLLNMPFHVFSLQVQGFSSDRKVLMSLLSVLFHLQDCLSFLKF